MNTKTVLIIAGVLIVAFIAYKVYKHHKQKEENQKIVGDKPN